MTLYERSGEDIDRGLVGDYKLDDLKSPNIVSDNLVTNGDFANWSGVADPGNTPDDWTVLIDGGGVDPTRMVQDTFKSCRIVTEGNIITVGQNIGLVVGQSYFVKLNITDVTAGALSIGSISGGSDVSSGLSTTGNHIIRFIAAGNYISFKRATGGGDDVTFTDVEVYNDGGAIDRANFNDGIITGCTNIEGINGLSPDAMLFDGVDDIIDTGADVIGTGDLSISFWSKAKGFGGTNVGIIVTNAKTALTKFVTNSRLRFTSNGFVNVAYSATNSLVFDVWQHWVITRTSAGVTNFYLNGILNGAADQASGTPSSGTNDVLIGDQLIGSRTFDGTMQNFRIHNRILTPGEISKLHRLKL